MNTKLKTTDPIRAYHFVGAKLRDGSAIPPDGEWLEFKGEARCCQSGLHASLHVADAIRYAPGFTLCLVELQDIADSQDDKLCAHRRKIVARFDATELLRPYARANALSVIHLWKAPAVVRQYLETGDESIRVEARNAAAAYTAAAYTADTYDAAYAAAAAAADAYPAAYARKNWNKECRGRLAAAVNDKFASMGVKNV